MPSLCRTPLIFSSSIKLLLLLSLFQQLFICVLVLAPFSLEYKITITLEALVTLAEYLWDLPTAIVLRP